MNETKEYKDKVLDRPLEIINDLIDVFTLNGPKHIADIGACDGLSSIKYMFTFPNSRVVAFEPREDNYKKLEENISLYGFQDKITTRRIALGDKAEKDVEFWESYGQAEGINDHDTGNMSSSLYRPKDHLQAHTWCKFKSSKTDVVRLDDLEFKGFDFIHIDVQGAELKVFKGAEESLKSVKAIWCEVANIELYEGQPRKRDILKFLGMRGFKCTKDTCGNNKFGDCFLRRK
jgi:FkbM family methyltransferase